MKNQAILLAALGLTLGFLHGQTVPLYINYQGKVTGGTGIPLGSTGTAPNFTAAPVNRKVIFRIFDAQTAGNRLWSEQQTVTISLGEFSVLLGQGTDAVYNAVTETRPALDTVFTTGGAVSPAGPGRYLEIVVDDGNGTFTAAADIPITPRQRITTTAYSFRARIADTVAAATIDASALATGSVTGVKILDSAITTEKIANLSILNEDLANSSVTSDKIADLTVGTADLANNSVTAAKIDTGSVGLWSVTGGNVFRPAGAVGIGKQPAVPLDVNGAIAASGNITTAASITASGNITATGALTGSSITTTGPFSATTITANAGVRIPGNNVLELGAGVAGKDGSAGKIGYQSFSPSLDIVGAGTTGANRRVRIWAEGGTDFTGNVGIGTNGPGDRLTLAGGAIRIDDGTGRFVRMYRSVQGFIIEGNSFPNHGLASSVVQWDGDGNWDHLSDGTLKKDIADAEPVLERLMQLHVRRYRWKDRPSDAPRSFGVIAQEVKPLFPDVIGTMLREGATEEKMTVKTAAFGLIAAKAVQELKQEKDAEVKALQKENALLRDRLAALEASDKARDAKLAAIEKLLLSPGKSEARTVSLKARR
jgi:hypothetical protein